MAPVDVETKLKDGMVHMDCVYRLYLRQLKTNKVFLHGHPRSARSWGIDLPSDYSNNTMYTRLDATNATLERRLGRMMGDEPPHSQANQVHVELVGGAAAACQRMPYTTHTQTTTDRAGG